MPIETVRKAIDPAVYVERCCSYGDDPTRPMRDAARKELESMLSAVQRLEQDPRLNAAEVLERAAELVRKKAADREVFLDVAKQSLHKQQASVELQIEAALQPPRATWAALAPEIRTMLRSMPEEDRYALVNEAHKTDDFLPIFHAVASAPAALSGLAPGKAMEIRDTVLGIRDPALLSRPKQIAHELKMIDACIDGYRRSVAELVDFGKADALAQLVGDPA